MIQVVMKKLVCNSKHVHKFPSQYTKGNSQANIIELIVLTILNDIFTHFWMENRITVVYLKGSINKQNV